MKITEYKSQEFKHSKGYIKTICIHANPHANGGEAVVVEIDVYDNGDNDSTSKFYNTRILTTCCGSHSAEISLWTIDVFKLAEVIMANKFKVYTELKENG